MALHRLFFFSAALLVAMPVVAAPARIVSMNLCTDQYLIALADPGQIAALTQLARDPEMSAAAVEAKSLPVFRATAEELLALEPDLILGMPPGFGKIAALAKTPMLDLPPANSYPEIVGQIRTVARAVGQIPRGEALIASMDRELTRLPRATSDKIAAHYQRRGFLTGTGTLVDDLLRRVGLKNLATGLNKPVLAQMSLEQLIAAQPDYLIVESASGDIADQGTEMLDHPAIRSIPRLVIPRAWTVCGGPAYVRAAKSLAEQLSAGR